MRSPTSLNIQVRRGWDIGIREYAAREVLCAGAQRAVAAGRCVYGCAARPCERPVACCRRSPPPPACRVQRDEHIQKMAAAMRQHTIRGSRKLLQKAVDRLVAKEVESATPCGHESNHSHLWGKESRHMRLNKNVNTRQTRRDQIRRAVRHAQAAASAAVARHFTRLRRNVSPRAKKCILSLLRKTAEREMCIERYAPWAGVRRRYITGRCCLLVHRKRPMVW